MIAVRGFVAALVFLGSSAHGATDGELAQQVASCRELKEDAARLACFDGIKVADSHARQATSSAPIAAPAAPVASKTAEFGATGTAVAAKRKAEQEKDESTAEPKRMTAVITEVKQRPRGEFVVTLDNGQVWAQKNPERFPTLNNGQTVTILAGVLGSYRLIANGRATAVTRLE